MENIDYKNIMPELVAEYIEENVLPTYADGHNTAEMIADIMIDEALSRLVKEKYDITAYMPFNQDLSVLDSWVVRGSHKKVIIGYIQAVFDSWEREGGNNINVINR